MNAKIIRFPRRPYDNDAVVAHLEHTLALAKEGKIKFVGIATVNDQGIGYASWAPDDELSHGLLTSALGSVSFLNARLLEASLAGVDEPDEAA